MTFLLTVQVPVGSRFVGIPGTKSPQNPGGIMVEVYWEPDDSGRLCISGHSQHMPIPPHIQLPDPQNAKSARPLGVVIDPAQLKMLQL